MNIRISTRHPGDSHSTKAVESPSMEWALDYIARSRRAGQRATIDAVRERAIDTPRRAAVPEHNREMMVLLRPRPFVALKP